MIRKLILVLSLMLTLPAFAWAAGVDILQTPQWGLSRAEIIRQFPAAEANGDDRLDFYVGKGYGGEVTASYFFAADKLMYVRYNIEVFETEEFITPKGYDDLLAGLQALYGEPVVREVDKAVAGQPQTYVLDWINAEKAVAFQRNGEIGAIHWMRVEHIDPVFLK